MVTVLFFLKEKRFCVVYIAKSEMKFPLKKYLFHVIMLELVRQFLSLNSLTLYFYIVDFGVKPINRRV